MKIILILTQNYKNASVAMLTTSLNEAQGKEKKYKTIVWEINKNRSTEVEGDSFRIVYKKDDAAKFSDDHVLLSDIVLVIKRTWSSIREEVLKICQQLERRGIYVFGRPGFWRG